MNWQLQNFSSKQIKFNRENQKIQQNKTNIEVGVDGVLFIISYFLRVKDEKEKNTHIFFN